MIDEIKSLLLTYGYDPAETGTVIGKSHMAFENLKSLMTQGDSLIITKEVRRGEGILIKYYKKALALDPPSEVKNLLLTHLKKIQDDIKESDLLPITS